MMFRYKAQEKSTDITGSRSKKYSVSARNTQGIQIGDGNIQQNMGTCTHTQGVRSPDSSAEADRQAPAGQMIRLPGILAGACAIIIDRWGW